MTASVIPGYKASNVSVARFKSPVPLYPASSATLANGESASSESMKKEMTNAETAAPRVDPTERNRLTVARLMPISSLAVWFCKDTDIVLPSVPQPAPNTAVRAATIANGTPDPRT